MDKKSYENKPDFSFVEQKVREVQETIENAVKSQNYQELNQSITRMVNNTLKQYQKKYPGTVRKNRQEEPVVPKTTELYANTKGERTKAILLTVFGGILSGTMAMGLLAVQILQVILGRGTMVSTAVTFLGTLAGIGMIFGGCKSLGRINRFKKYIRALGERTYCDFECLARAGGRSVRSVKKDIRFMIQKGWFLEGRTDQRETCLITSAETYRQYEETEKSLAERRRSEEEKVRQEEQKKEKINPAVQEVLDKGDAYIKKIHESNDAIPGEEISEKIARMEEIVDQIFQRAEEHPEIIPDLKKMMDYYLPMTVKLLDAYEDMDRQPVQGETILASKKEIEDTLDTLNEAFANILDSVFQDKAWDLSSDISVLHTMLAQEGLTGKDFRMK